MNESLLVNTLGHSAGVLIFGIFLYLLVQDRAARRLRGSAKSMLAAALALLWNLASLVALATNSAPSTFNNVSAALAFSVLSLLPAVLFDLCLQDRFRVLVGMGYGLSAVTIGFHIAELFGGSLQNHRLGLALIPIGYGTLTCVAVIGVFASRDQNRRATTSRLVGSMSLFLLAMSFAHLRSEPATQIWSHELAFHHAAIPLALLVLLTDYRFILLDAFLRFLANLLLAAVFTFAAVEVWRTGFPNRPSTPFSQALLLSGFCFSLILFAMLRTRVQNLLTRLVFRRPDRDALIEKLKAPVRDEPAYLALAARQIGEFMGADASVIDDPRLLELDLRRPALVSELPRHHPGLEAQRVEVIVPLRLPSGGSHHVLLGRRSGGRRYLSEDLQALGRAAGQVVEQVEHYRESETRRLVAQAELRALQSQIHPHFLFNALNTLYGIIPREAKGARETVLNLSDIFRYFLETKKSFLPLEEELHIIKAYLEVERLRLGDKLHTEIEVEPEALTIPIPILSIQPLVENAVKHAISPKPGGGLVRLEARLDARGGLRVTVTDTGNGFKRQRESKSGVGLENVTRRLQLCYGPEAQLEIQSNQDGSSVSFLIPSPVASAARVELAR
ncbi:MAG TPA: histidine kinase [Bryobacteraceae bacterium]|nr:histidine kinase [Bryobacteraceae bacterium]